MDTIQRLIALFERFPGIGPRQAERFVQFLLRSSPSVRLELVDTIRSLAQSVKQCSSCMRYAGETGPTCSLCADPTREDTKLAIVASDTDVIALERSGSYRGRYFVLGGTISLASELLTGLRMKELLTHIDTNSLLEVILAFPANPEGDATATRVREEIMTLGKSIHITTLGRGLSTGSELEYADPETIKHAVINRR